MKKLILMQKGKTPKLSGGTQVRIPYKRMWDKRKSVKPYD